MAPYSRRIRSPVPVSPITEHHHRWRGRLDLVMRQTHRAGEKAFIDYSGKRPSIIDASTGEIIDVELLAGSTSSAASRRCSFLINCAAK